MKLYRLIFFILISFHFCAPEQSIRNSCDVKNKSNLEIAAGLSAANSDIPFCAKMQLDTFALVSDSGSQTFGNFVINKTSGTVTKFGGTDTFTVKLTVAPTSLVQLNISSGNIAIGTVSPSVLTFTKSDFSQTKSFTVTGVSYSEINSKTFQINLSSQSSDSSFNNTNFSPIAITSIELRKVIYVATNSGPGYDGALPGVSGADSKCNSDPAKPIGTALYKAMIVVPGQRIATVTVNAGNGQIDWVLKPNTNYVQSNGTPIFTTDSAGLFNFGTLTNSIGSGQTWTGFNSAGWTASAVDNCVQWTSNGGGNQGEIGNASITGNNSIYMNVQANCNLTKFIYCAQQ